MEMQAAFIGEVAWRVEACSQAADPLAGPGDLHYSPKCYAERSPGTEWKVGYAVLNMAADVVVSLLEEHESGIHVRPAEGMLLRVGAAYAYSVWCCWNAAAVGLCEILQLG